MNWKKRIDEWKVVLRREGVKTSRLVLARNMVRAILTGPVSRDTWRKRMRVCATCPVYDSRFKACRSTYPGREHIGCGCYTPFTALWVRPYRDGCWGHTQSSSVGWPAVDLDSSRLIAVLRFIRGK